MIVDLYERHSAVENGLTQHWDRHWVLGSIIFNPFQIQNLKLNRSPPNTCKTSLVFESLIDDKTGVFL